MIKQEIKEANQLSTFFCIFTPVKLVEMYGRVMSVI